MASSVASYGLKGSWTGRPQKSTRTAHLPIGKVYQDVYPDQPATGRSRR